MKPDLLSWTHYVSVIILLITIVISEVSSLECFYCRGLTNYDPNNCFHPEKGKTFVQECDRESICEKKVVKLSHWVTKVERGCSANCDGRKYIWADDFQAHCCEGRLCNSAPGWYPGVTIWSMVTVGFLVTWITEKLVR